MQVTNATTSYQANNNPSFGALKELQFVGKFKKSPKAQEKLLDAFEKSQPIKRFCETFDTKVYFDAYKDMNNKMLSMMIISYGEITEKTSGIKKWLTSLFGNPETITINAGSPFTFTPENAADDLMVQMEKQDSIFGYKIKQYEAEQKSIKEAGAKKLAEKEAKLKEKNEDTLIQEEVNERIKNLLNK